MCDAKRITYETFSDAEVVPVFGRNCRLVYLIPVRDTTVDGVWLLPEHTVGVLVYVGGCFASSTRAGVIEQFMSCYGSVNKPYEVICMGIDEDDVGWIVRDRMLLGYLDGNHRSERWRLLGLPDVWPHVHRIFDVGYRHKWKCSVLSAYLLAGASDGGRDVIGLGDDFGKLGACNGISSFLSCAGSFLMNAQMRCYIAYVKDNVTDFVNQALSDGYVISVGVVGHVRFPLGSILPSDENNDWFDLHDNHRFTLFPIAGISKSLFVDSYHVAWYDANEIAEVFSQIDESRGVVVVMAPASRLSADGFAEWLYDELQMSEPLDFVVDPRVPSFKSVADELYSDTNILNYTEFSLAEPIVPKHLSMAMSKCYDELLTEPNLLLVERFDDDTASVKSVVLDNEKIVEFSWDEDKLEAMTALDTLVDDMRGHSVLIDDIDFEGR